MSADNEALKKAGESMFQILINTGCAHADPRHPRNDECAHCRRKGEAMTAWDDALIAAARAARAESMERLSW